VRNPLRFLRRRPRRTPDAHMTIVEHLAELRRRIFISLIAVVAAAIVCFIFSNSIIHFLLEYYKNASNGKQSKLIFTGPLDAFLVRLKVATYGGIVLAVPVWLWQLWRFVTPGLHSNEKRYAVPFILSSIVLFALGAWVALLTLTKALSFLINVGGSSLQPLLAADKYLSLVGLMILAFGLSFEFPVVLMFLLIARILTTAQLRRWRRVTIVVIVVFAAVITPSQDPYSLFFMAVPMYVFYEACILIGRVLKR
jgi:sec-independent protein translocase protein TatC